MATPVLNLPRRITAWWLLTVGLLCASMAYQGFVVRTLVLDPDLVVDAADGVLSNRQLQESVADQVAKAMLTQLMPSGVQPALQTFGVDAQRDFQRAAVAVVSGPQFHDLYADALHDLHAFVFTDHFAAPVIDASALVGQLRAEAVAINPAYAQYLPAAGTLRVTVPDDLPDLSGARRRVDGVLATLTVVAVLTTAAAFALHPRRDAVLRRLGRWLVSITVFQVGLALVAPVAARALPGDAAVVVSTVLGALVPRLLAPALALMLFGVGAIVAGRRWRTALDGGGTAAGAVAFLDPDGTGVSPPVPEVARGVPAWAYRTDEVPVVEPAAAPTGPPAPTRATATSASVFPHTASVFDDPPTVRPLPRS